MRKILLIYLIILCTSIIANGNTTNYIVSIDKAKLRDNPNSNAKVTFKLPISYEFKSKEYLTNNENGINKKWIYVETEYLDKKNNTIKGWLLENEVIPRELLYNKKIAKVATNINNCNIEFWFDVLQCKVKYIFHNNGSFIIELIGDNNIIIDIRKGYLYKVNDLLIASIHTNYGLPGSLLFYKKNNKICINTDYLVGGKEVCADCFNK